MTPAGALAPPNGAGSALLGISGESVDARGRSTVPDRKGRAKAAANRHRLELTREAGSLLYREELLAKEQHATVWCHRVVRQADGGGQILRRLDGSRARLTGVTTCGMVWTCAVCAAKIAEERRRELQAGMVRHVKAGGAAYLLTLTFPHELGEFTLHEQLALFTKALGVYKASRAYRRILGPKGSAARLGSVKSLEVTHGPNGFHPHVHELIFARRRAFGEGAPGEEPSLSSIDIDELRAAWLHALLKVRLLPAYKLDWAVRYAFDLRGGEAAADYIAKFGKDGRWGQSQEMTGHVKKIGAREVEGRAHRTPFQLLADSMAGDQEAGALFIVYASAFRGKRQLTWSPGLKRALGLRDLTDEEIAGDDAPRPEEVAICDFTMEQLALITSRRALGEVVEFVCLYCDDPAMAQFHFDEFVAALKDRPPGGLPTLRHVRKHAEGFDLKHGATLAFERGTPAFEELMQ